MERSIKLLMGIELHIFNWGQNWGQEANEHAHILPSSGLQRGIMNFALAKYSTVCYSVRIQLRLYTRQALDLAME